MKNPHHFNMREIKCKSCKTYKKRCVEFFVSLDPFHLDYRMCKECRKGVEDREKARVAKRLLEYQKMVEAKQDARPKNVHRKYLVTVLDDLGREFSYIIITSRVIIYEKILKAFWGFKMISIELCRLEHYEYNALKDDLHIVILNVVNKVYTLENMIRESYVTMMKEWNVAK